MNLVAKLAFEEKKDGAGLLMVSRWNTVRSKLVMEYPEVLGITHVLEKGFLPEMILLGFPVTCALTPVIPSNKSEVSKLQVNNPFVKCI